MRVRLPPGVLNYNVYRVLAPGRITGGAMRKPHGRIKPTTFPASMQVGTGPVAQLFNVHRTTVAGWCEKGILLATKLPGGSHWRIRWSDAVALHRRF